MAFRLTRNIPILVFAALGVASFVAPAAAQVTPFEIRNPRLRAAEQAHLTNLIELNRAIANLKFAFPLALNRYAGLDPKDQIGADTRGLEFVDFHGRVVLKITGNYNAAFNANTLTQNERSSRIFADIVTPILGLIPAHISPADDFDCIGFEIAYHVREQTKGYEYEGKEVLTIVLDKSDAFKVGPGRTQAEVQDVLNRSDVYVNGKPFGIAPGQRQALDVDFLPRAYRGPGVAASREPKTTIDPAEAQARSIFEAGNVTGGFRRTGDNALAAAPGNAAGASSTAASQRDVDALQSKYQSQLDDLGREGALKYHFVDYSPPAFVLFRNKVYLQITLREPGSFNGESSSIYKRAAQSFDLFLAPLIKPILSRIAQDEQFGGLDITVLDEVQSKSGRASEAIEYVCPMKPLKQFAEADITNQELINQSIVMVNGVRIALNLQQVE
jgi:hypothetical protein